MKTYTKLNEVAIKHNLTGEIYKMIKYDDNEDYEVLKEGDKGFSLFYSPNEVLKYLMNGIWEIVE